MAEGPVAPGVATAAVHGYSLVLPPGWARIPLRHGTDEVIREILDRSFHGLPRDRFGPLRAELEKRLGFQVRAAREAGGLDLYLPVERAHDVTVAASFLVSEVSFDRAGVAAPADVAAALVAADPSAAVVPLDGVAAVRTDRRAAGSPAAGPAGEELPASRRVEYTVAVPGDPQRWLTVAFSTVAPDSGPDGDLAQLPVALFDALMTTFRWRRDAARAR